MNYTQKIVDFIKENRVSTTEVADALAKTGVLPGVLPVNADQFKVGPVRCVFTCDESNYAVHEQVREVKKGEVVVVFTHNTKDRAILGELIAKFILLYRGAEALVVDAPIRDVSVLRREKFAVWAKGVNPVGCFNRPAGPFPKDLELELRGMYEDGIAVCDDGGVVVIPPNKVDEEMLERLHRIEMQEDVWRFCLNTLKWDTKRIVCDKEYLEKTELMPLAFLEIMARLNESLDK